MNKKSIHEIEEEKEYLDLLSKGYEIDINEALEKGFGVNALYYASKEKKDWLISHGININHTDEYGQNMLHNSTYNDWVFWIKQGININQIDNGGENILFFCKYFKQMDLFIKNNIDIHVVNKKNENLNIHLVNNKGQNVLFINNTTPEMKAIWIEKGVDVNLENTKGETPLFYANSTLVIDLLLEKGIDINKKNKSNENAFIHYCKYDDLIIVKHLMKKGIDVNIDLSIVKSKIWKSFSSRIKEFLTINMLVQKEKEHLLKNLKEDELNDIYKKRL